MPSSPKQQKSPSPAPVPESQHHQFQVEMHCKGCSGAVERVLGRMEGIERVETDLKTQLVDVYGTAPMDQILEAIAKTGKKVTPLTMPQ